MSMQTYTADQVLKSATLFKELVHLLDLCFANDTLTNWIFKKYSHEEFLKRLTYYHRYLLRAALRSGASTIVIYDDIQTAPIQRPTDRLSGSNMKAIAVLIPPSGNQCFDSAFNHVRAGFPSFARRAGFGGTFSFAFDFVPKLDTLISAMYPAPNEHKRHYQWHLLFLATRPDCQGQGLGKKLLLECQKVVTEARLEDKTAGKEVGPLYLEASSMDSRRLYTRVGFVDRGDMGYGECKEGEARTVGKDGKIVGGRLFAMTWEP